MKGFSSYPNLKVNTIKWRVDTCMGDPVQGTNNIPKNVTVVVTQLLNGEVPHLLVWITQQDTNEEVHVP
jgi:hypothetical protein